MPSSNSRQLSIVDLVTLLLLVLIVAMEDPSSDEGTGPGIRDGFAFQFEVVSSPGTQNKFDAPRMGVSLSRKGHQAVVSPGNGALATPELEMIDPNGRTIMVYLFLEARDLRGDQAVISIFPRDLSSLKQGEISVRARYLDPVASRANGQPTWVDIASNSQSNPESLIQLASNGRIGSTPLCQIDLSQLQNEKIPQWENAF